MAQTRLGPSGLPLPRFVSLKSDRVNMRAGPGTDYPIAWTYQQIGWPLEIVEEFDFWRKVRDRDGEEGWVHKDLLRGKRMAVTTGEALLLRRPQADAVPVARLLPEVLAEIVRCKEGWCRLSVGSYQGWVPEGVLYGVYPGEEVE
ncbi:MAG: SH3 domain-containing protein [Alphaproteobacteria bacterium]|nr:SH3 domain-containing protein [Alphaproteobacteria bacterium]